MSHILSWFTVAIISFWSCFIPLLAQDVSLTVIGNEKGVPPEMKLNQLKSIMKGEKQRWPDGTKVTIALMKTNTPVGVSTGKKVYNMSANELNKYWLALVFQGKAEAPNFFNTENELETFVAQTPGAIGIISQVAGSNKVLHIEGKRSL